MIGVLVALMVGVMFGTGAYMLLRREPINLILGLSLLSYGVNVLLFSTSTMRRGLPPIIGDKESFTGDIAPFVDPLPQALILTAIVISFGVTAFVVALVNRRNALLGENGPADVPDDPEVVNDPFAAVGHFLSGLDSDPDDYEWLEDRVDLLVPADRTAKDVDHAA
jgi:multicomponent Na+:H+ antiporter subunit C